MGRHANKILIVAISLTYAIIRYHRVGYGTLSHDQISGFILNKALAFSALAMLVLAVAARPLAQRWERLFGGLARDRRQMGLTGLGLAAVHSLLSLTMLTPAYFGKLHQDDGRMNLAGELSTLVGVVALVILVWQSRLPPASESDDRRLLRRLGLIVLVLIAVHVLAIGWPSWMVPSDWPGYLPPITLVSFALAIAGLALGLLPSGRRG